MKLYFFLFTAFIFLLTNKSTAQNSYKYERTVCILDLTLRNGETNISYLHAADHMLKVHGLPYTIEISVDSAFKYGIVIASSKITSTTLSSSEITSLYKYVDQGGIFIAGSYTGMGDLQKSDSLNKLFGISDTRSQNNLFRMSFIKNPTDTLFRWINDAREDTISLGNDTSTFTTRSYQISTGVPLARFEDGSNAIVKNSYGQGKTYIIGFAFRDLISLSQQDIDYHAERAFSNTFEPGADALMLFIKAIYTQKFPFSVWKHTIPDKRKGALILTHDMDSQTAMDLITQFSIYEYRKNIISTFNITTRYFHDWLMGSFFLPSQNITRLDSARVHCNHVMGCHSIGHFPDMDDDGVFEVGIRDHYDTNNYHPHYNGTVTSGGILYAEVQLSKQLIENRLPIKIRTWRSGNLTFPKVLNNLLDTLGYDFNSSNSANDVLTNFPFRGRTDKSNNGVYTRVTELPMTISDVFYEGHNSHSKSDTINQIDFEAKVSLWKDITMKCADNYAPTVLLIHPNRSFKLDALKSFLNKLPLGELDLKGMENFGDFWRYRDSVSFYSSFKDDTLKIIIPSAQLPIQRKLGFVVDNGQQLDSAKLVVIDEQGNYINHYRYDWYENGKYIMFEPASVWIDGDTIPGPEFIAEGFKVLSVYPNPFFEEIKLDISSDIESDATVKLYNVLGCLIFTKTFHIKEGKSTLTFDEFSNMSKALYIIKVSSRNYSYTYKIIKE